MNKDKMILLPNIGKALNDRMKEAGISNAEKLIELGAEQSFILLQAIEPDSCLNTLYTLEGAIQGIRWHNLSQKRKDELKLFFDQTKEDYDRKNQ